MSPDGLHSININSSSDGSGSASASKRPMGVKKSKMKKKMGDDLSVVVEQMKANNQKLHQMFESSSAKRDREMEIQLKRIDAQHKAIEAKNRMVKEYRWDVENKVLMVDTESISNPARRMFFEQEQAKIMARRQAQLNQFTPPNNTFDYDGDYFSDVSGGGFGSENGLGDY